MPPGFIRFALSLLFLINLVPWRLIIFSSFFFTFKHFVSLLFYIRLIAW